MKVGSESVHLFVSGHLLSHIVFPLSGLIVFDAVTPSGTPIHSVGPIILLAPPFINSAYILRDVGFGYLFCYGFWFHDCNRLPRHLLDGPRLKEINAPRVIEVNGVTFPA
jgi:hypothetical protein